MERETRNRLLQEGLRGMCHRLFGSNCFPARSFPIIKTMNDSQSGERLGTTVPTWNSRWFGLNGSARLLSESGQGY